MEEKRTGLFENGLIWFGAGVSIAEILTGTYLKLWKGEHDYESNCCKWPW